MGPFVVKLQYQTRHTTVEHVKLQAMWRYSTKILRIGLALSLSLWVAGAGCMLGCESMVASAASTDSANTQPQAHHQSIVVSGEACAATQTHDCCGKKKAEVKKLKPTGTVAKPSLQTATRVSSTESLSPAPTGSMMECPLALGRAVAISKTSGANHNASALETPIKTLPVETFTEQYSALTPVARPPNRGHTYLRCCVFLI